jgi:cytochrome P450
MVVTGITVYIISTLDKRKRKRVSGASPLPLPPGPVALPLIGNAFSFIGPFGHSPHRILTSLARTYGSIVSFRPGMAGDFVVVSSPEAAHEALVKNDAALAARFVPDNTRALGHSSESIFFLPTSSHVWKQHRITVGTRFSTGRGLDITRHIRDRHGCRLSEQLRLCSGMPVKVGEAALGAVIDVMSNILFSKDVAHLRVEGGQLFKDLLVEVLEDWTKPNVSDAFPFIGSLDLLGSRRRISRGLTKLYKFFDEELIEPRLGSSENHHDLLDNILSQHTKSKLTRSEITPSSSRWAEHKYSCCIYIFYFCTFSWGTDDILT